MTSSRRGFALARKLALALPDVEEGTSWGTTAFKLRGKMMACQPTNKSAELDSLVVLKLLSNRDKDRTHLRDLIGVGLVDASWLDKVPPELADRLKQILDTPEG